MVLALMGLLGMLAPPGMAAVGGRTRLVSISSKGVQGDDGSYYPATSADGRYVAFASFASNLVPGDTNAQEDVFVRDLERGKTTIVSVSSAGDQGDDFSDGPTISADGRYVAFYSAATNLVPGDTNGHRDVFVYDRALHKTSRVSLGRNGTQGDSDSAVGSISANGRFVAFISAATNLVRGDTNGVDDVFVRDRKLGTTTRVSVSSSGKQGDGYSENSYSAISASGRFVAFRSVATNLVPGDTNATDDVFVRDRKLGKTTRVSLSRKGGSGNNESFDAAISSDGRFVVFSSDADNLVRGDTNAKRDVFVRDRKLATTALVSVSTAGSQGNANSNTATISAGGRYVAFQSDASNLVSHDTNATSDVFLRDLARNRTVRISVSSSGAQGDGNSVDASISADGRFVAFMSGATNLAVDSNGYFDVFLRGPLS